MEQLALEALEERLGEGVDGADLAHGPLLLGPTLSAGPLGGKVPVVAGAGRSEHPAA